MTSQSGLRMAGPDGALPPPLRIAISCPDEGTIVVTPAGESDIQYVGRLRQALLNATREGSRCVIVDLDHLTFMDATTLGTLVAARRRINADGGSLVVRCDTRRNRRLLTMTGLGGMLDRSE